METQVLRVPIIPGSSLKGVLRSVAETVGNGCFRFVNERDNPVNWNFPPVEYGRSKLPPRVDDSFLPCRNNGELCIACRIFGMIGGNQGVLKGKVSINDAKPVGGFTMMGKKTLKILINPKPRHRAFYNPGGRKFYFHHQNMDDITHWTTTQQTDFNSSVNPVSPGVTFSFTVDIFNLNKDEFSLLLYSLVLEPSMRHKMGYAKPLGLGSVEIRIEKIEIIEPANRYSSAGGGQKIYVGQEKDQYIKLLIDPFIQSTEVNLRDLRRIWGWNPADNTIYKYPTQEWFSDHPTKLISQTP